MVFKGQATNPYATSTDPQELHDSDSPPQGIFHAAVLGPLLAVGVGVVHALFAWVTWHFDGETAIAAERMSLFMAMMIGFNVVFGLSLGFVNAVIIKAMTMQIHILAYSVAVICVAIIIFGLTCYRQLANTGAELFGSWMLPMASVYLVASFLSLLFAKRSPSRTEPIP